MRSFLTRILAFALALIFAVGLIPTAFADEEVRMRDTAYSEIQGIRVAMSGKVSDTANFAVDGPEGALTIIEVIGGEKNIYTIVTAEPIDVTAAYTFPTSLPIPSTPSSGIRSMIPCIRMWLIIMPV